MNDCIFCQQISDGSLKPRIINQDDNFIAFLDGTNLVKGHTLAIPKSHYKYVWDYPNPGEYFNFVNQVVRQLKTALGIEKVDLLVSGKSVPHAHFHLLPATSGVWFSVMDFLRTQRKNLTPTETTIEQEFIEKLRVR